MKAKFASSCYSCGAPIKVGKELVPLGGGRVTELTIRPLFNMYFPRLSGFIQPLSGEYAGRREFLERIPLRVILNDKAALLGAAHCAFGRLPQRA